MQHSVHPRVCGEQLGLDVDLVQNTGSSPRVRGTERQVILRKLIRRFIPACAGNRASAIFTAARSTVHPRVCGEQTKSRTRSRRSCGSSPRVRGTDSPRSRSNNRSRFIPACAGNRPQFQSARQSRSVHPRVCGEQAVIQVIKAKRDGSSPRVRGTDCPLENKGSRPRFIPACAGNR